MSTLEIVCLVFAISILAWDFGVFLGFRLMKEQIKSCLKHPECKNCQHFKVCLGEHMKSKGGCAFFDSKKEEATK